MEEDTDDNDHQKLINAFSQKNRKDVRRELGTAGEISAIGAPTEANFLSLSQLVNSSVNVKKSKNVTLKLNKSGKGKTLKAQPNSAKAVAAERNVDFSAVTNQVSEWEPLVKSNRQAEKLLFPLDKEPLTHFATASDISKRAALNPSTLEQQIYATLKAAGCEAPSKETGLTAKETASLDKLDYNEAMQRLKELRRHRILTGQQLARFKREKSVKSKKFKRLKTRYKMEKMQDELTSKGLSSTLRERRIIERTTLRHRVTGKWDRKLAHYAKHEKSTQDELESKRRMNKSLTVKQDDEEMSVDESDESEDEEWQVVTNKRGPKQTSNPDSEEASGSDSEPLVDDVETEEVIEFRKDIKDNGETPLEIGGGIKRKSKSVQNQLNINPSSFLTSTSRSSDGNRDIFLATSVNTSAIHEAFEDDEDLIEEMQDEEDKSEKEENICDFGWGSWTGPGLSTTKEAKLKESKSKKDDKAMKKNLPMGYVVFNNVQNEKLAEHQLKVRDVPFGYKKSEAFESSMRQPIGPDFNTSASFKSLIEPRIRKKVGVAIEPMAREDDKKESKFTF